MTTQVEKSRGQDVARSTKSSWPSSFEEFFDSLWDWGAFGFPRRTLSTLEGSPMRIEEAVEANNLIVRAELPGVDPEKDVQITVDDGMLTIKAERRTQEKKEQNGGYRSEFHYGRFVRRVRVPKDADLDSLSASYKDGVLEVHLPLKGEPASTARTIPVTRS
jgi:HSP20 family protein